MADAGDLKSSGDFTPCGFDSHPGHQLNQRCCNQLTASLLACTRRVPFFQESQRNRDSRRAVGRLSHISTGPVFGGTSSQPGAVKSSLVARAGYGPSAPAAYSRVPSVAAVCCTPPATVRSRSAPPSASKRSLRSGTRPAAFRYHTEKLKLSFLLFDEIEKASDALWQLLLGILLRGGRARQRG